MQYQELSHLIKSRRSIFPSMYNDKPIKKETILSILDNANWAPNHKKTEPWRFKIFQGDSLTLLSDYLSNYYKENTPEDKFSQKKYKKTITKIRKSNCIIALCMYDDPEIDIPKWEQRAAVACAVQNIWLSCTSLGIGSYWSSPKSIINAKKFLNLSDHEECLGLFYMGYTDVVDLPSKRMSIEDKIEWV